MPVTLELLLLVILANGAPLLLYDLLGQRWNQPLDGGLRLWDGKRLFGSSVTLRGVAGALICTTAGAVAMGQDTGVGISIGVWAMIGDAFSSFVKRRLGLAPGSMALGLDQVPESLLPLLAVRRSFGLTWPEIGLLVLSFVILELLLSRLLYRLHLRKRPY